MAPRLAHPPGDAAVENQTQGAAKCLQWKRKAGGAEGCDSSRWRLAAGAFGAVKRSVGIDPSCCHSGNNRIVKQVRIGELKAHLSAYLRAVRRGETVTVLDRDTPVAQIVPACEPAALRIRKPARGAPPLNRVPLPKPLGLKTDVVELLLQERQPRSRPSR